MFFLKKILKKKNLLVKKIKKKFLTQIIIIRIASTWDTVCYPGLLRCSGTSPVRGYLYDIEHSAFFERTLVEILLLSSSFSLKNAGTIYFEVTKRYANKKNEQRFKENRAKKMQNIYQ